MNFKWSFSSIFLIFSICSLANEGEILKTKGAQFQKANKKLILVGITSKNVKKKKTNIISNGIPNHLIGSFPHKNNSNVLTSQTYDFYFSNEPKVSKSLVNVKPNMFFGVALNGIPFTGGLNKWYQGNSKLGWQYEALSGAFPMGLDENSGALIRKGAYVYFGLPKLLLKDLGVEKGKLSPVIGHAADGFEIRALYGVNGKPVKSGYILKRGEREIGGTYDGTFSKDYEYINTGDALDECNGTFINGKYTYFLTSSYPVIPKCFMGKPDKSFLK